MYKKQEEQVEAYFEKWWNDFESAPGGLGLEFIPEAYRTRVWVGLKHTARRAFVTAYAGGYQDGERELDRIAFEKFPKAIKALGSGYFLDAHKLMSGHFRICYFNSKTGEKAWDVMNQFEVSLAMTENWLSKTPHEAITLEKWREEFDPPDGRCDRLDG